MSILATIGPTALYLLVLWLVSAITASDLADRKGYGEKPGLATGLLLSAAGAIVWLFVPPRRGSLWSRHVHMFDLLTAIAAVLLIGSLFVPWYSGGGNFFDRLALYDLIVPIGAAIAYAQLHARAGGRAPESLGTVAIAAAALALIGVIVAILTPPSGLDVEWGAYASVLFALLTTAGAVLASRVDRAAFDTGRLPADSPGVGAEAA